MTKAEAGSKRSLRRKRSHRISKLRIDIRTLEADADTFRGFNNPGANERATKLEARVKNLREKLKELEIEHAHDEHKVELSEQKKDSSTT
jgi:hypothetical protein